MARIAGVEVPEDKRIVIALTSIKGVGRAVSNKILEKVSVSEDRRTKDLSAEELAKIQKTVERDYVVEGALTRRVKLNIKRLKDIGCYRGRRHEMGLPVRGQRTKTNARTRKGRRSRGGGSSR